MCRWNQENQPRGYIEITKYHKHSTTRMQEISAHDVIILLFSECILQPEMYNR